jgi:hypothetical protein
MVDAGFSVDPAPAVMHFLTERLPDKDVSDIQRLIPRKDFVNAWKHVEDGAKELAKRLQGKEAATPSRTWHLLQNANPEALLYLDVTVRQQAVEQKIKNFFGKWRQLKDKLPFPEMAELRITPQLPEYPKIAEEAFMLLLDGKLRSHTEIIKFLKPYEPPPPPPPPPPPTKRGRGAKAAAASAPAGGAAAAQAPAVPGKRGRKPKGEVAAAAPAVAAVAVAAGDAPKKGTPVKTLDPAKKAVEKNAAPVKSAPAKAPAKAVAPAKSPARNAAPPKKAVPAKKPAAKKPAPKKTAKPANKAAKKKK